MKDSKDGGAAADFHAACDDKGPTVVVIESADGFKFGGAADKPWAPSSNHYTASSASFLFCLSCRGAQGSKHPFGDLSRAPHQLKLNGKYNQYALLHWTPWGPAFGYDGSDLRITPGSSTGAFSNLGYSYTCPVGALHSSACTSYLAGSQYFDIANYEVFVIKEA